MNDLREASVSEVGTWVDEHVQAAVKTLVADGWAEALVARSGDALPFASGAQCRAGVDNAATHSRQQRETNAVLRQHGRALWCSDCGDLATNGCYDARHETH